MKKSYLIGVDLGTSGTKAALYRTDGTLVAEAGVEVPIYYPRPGVVEQENDDFYATASQAVNRCIRDSGVEPAEVAAIAFDSQMAGIGSVDEDFRPATRFDSWLDMRCQPYIEAMDRQAGDRITELTGCAPTCDHGPKILWWMHERPADFDRIAKFVTPAGYVAGTMAGLKADQAFMDYTFIHFSGFSDSKSAAWSQELCDHFGLDMGKLPEIVEPWRVVGEVTPAAARDFGLAPGTAVAAGCGDTAACALGAGAVVAGDGVRLRRNGGGAGGLHRPFCRRPGAPCAAVHAFGHPGGLQPAGLHRRRRDRAALVPRSVLQHAARARNSPGRAISTRR